MIYESAPWKDDLLRLSRDLERYQSLRRWSERSSVRLEKILMLGFYSIRKLVEAHKVSDAIANQAISLVAYPWRGELVTTHNSHRIDEKYNLEAGLSASRSLPFVSNQVIHSYVFMFQFNDAGRLDALLVNSDRTRHEALFSVPISAIAQLFRTVGTNYPSSAHWVFDDTKDDFRVSVGP